MNLNKQIEKTLIEGYDIAAYPFRDWFCKCLGTEDLESLHVKMGVTANTYAQQVMETRLYCEERVSGLQLLVKRFLDTFVVMRFGSLLAFQEKPTIRFHFAVDEPALYGEAEDIFRLDSSKFLKKYYHRQRVGMFHRDKDYGLTSDSVNMWIPITDVAGSNSLWLGGPNNGGLDAKPILLRYGQALFFDGASRWHGVVWNTSNKTRVSFDIRFRPEKLFNFE